MDQIGGIIIALFKLFVLMFGINFIAVIYYVVKARKDMFSTGWINVLFGLYNVKAFFVLLALLIFCMVFMSVNYGQIIW